MVRPCELSGFNQDSPSLRIIASFPIFQSSSWSCTQTGSLISRAVCLSFGLLFVRLVDWINQGCRHHPGVERCFQGETHQIHRGPKRTTGDESVPFCRFFCMVPWMMIRIMIILPTSLALLSLTDDQKWDVPHLGATSQQYSKWVSKSWTKSSRCDFAKPLPCSHVRSLRSRRDQHLSLNTRSKRNLFMPQRLTD